MAVINPKISVIIPTLNAESYLPELINKLKRQTVKPLEIIVIDSQSTDNTVAITKELGVKLLTIARKDFDHGGTRNYAASIALGDIFLFMTQDAVPANEYTIENLIKPLLEPNVVLSYARQLPKKGTMITDKFLRLYNYSDTSLIKSKADIEIMGIKTFQNSNVCAAYKRKGFKQLGGFAEPIVSNEDMLFAAKAILAGFKVAYTAEACVLHSHNYSKCSIFKRYFDIGASLDNLPEIKDVGKAESNGLDFIIKQLKYIVNEKYYFSIFEVIVEAICKYVGYKLGTKHCFVPNAWQKVFGLNKTYWSNQ